jgi:succinate dehydrogenase / fumarate reductase flavoprotein subunit
VGITLRRGIPAEDMEFYQFHPTGIYKLGILITEGVRGEGGVLLNNENERFMETYAPTAKDLASRDVVSRAMYLEMRDGRGIDGKRYLNLDVRPDTVNKYALSDGRTFPDGSPYQLSAADVMAKLPDIIDFCRTYMDVDPVTQPMPVQPTAHYAMGGIPTDVHGRVLIDEKNTVMPGLYSAGECACVSVHGANRLGTNSLLDLIVFGKESGLRAAEFAKQNDFVGLPEDAEDFTSQQLDALRNGSGKENAADLRKEMQKVMFDHVGVFRTQDGMREAVDKVRELKQRFKEVRVDDQGHLYNTDILEAWEVGCLLDIAEVTAVSALERTESRGAHAREDYPKREDKQWLKHTLAFLQEDKVELRYKPVTITKYEPKERVY